MPTLMKMSLYAFFVQFAYSEHTVQRLLSPATARSKARMVLDGSKTHWGLQSRSRHGYTRMSAFFCIVLSYLG